MKRLLRCNVSTLALHPLAAPRRHCATTPTEDEVRKAYKVLGVHATASLADVKKRYGSLAKEHHPDVATSTATSSTNRMTDINSAYNTVKQFYQSGGKLSSQHTPPGAGASSSYAGSSSYYTQQDSAYQPWYEDMDPLMYELMWEEMRRQNEEAHFASAEGDFNHMGGGSQWRPPRHNHFAGGRGGKQRGTSSAGTDRANAQGKGGGGTGAASKTTTWPEEQVKAMVNMYQDGKSFDFIANALGKANGEAVMEEFNRWSADSQSSRRRQGHQHGNRGHRGGHSRRRRSPSGPHDFYYAESPDDIPFELYEMMEEEPYFDGAAGDMGNPFGYYTGDAESYDGHYGNATPFYGTHQMSGGVPPFPQGGPRGNTSGGGRVYNSNRNASFKPPRHHRGGTPHKAKRNNSTHGGSTFNNQNTSKK